MQFMMLDKHIPPPARLAPFWSIALRRAIGA